MAMQPNAWMTAFLFSAWITHFLSIVRRRYGISQANRHLLILNGHGSHVTLEVVQKTKSEGLDIITLPSHTNYRLQPLDVTIFKPFKTTFRACRDRWTIQNKGQTARKEDLVEWMSKGLQKALTVTKITKGFTATGIWPLRPSAMDPYMQPSACYVEPVVQKEDNASDKEETTQENIEATEDFVPETQATEGTGEQYFVDAEVGSDTPSSDSIDTKAGSEGEMTNNATRRNLFPLPQVERPARRVSREGEPLIDYSKSIIMTSDDYIAAVMAKAARKEVVVREWEERKIQAEQKKAQREEEKAHKEADKVLHRIQMDRKKAEHERERARKAADRERKAPAMDWRRHNHGVALVNIGGMPSELGNEAANGFASIGGATATFSGGTSVTISTA